MALQSFLLGLLSLVLAAAAGAAPVTIAPQGPLPTLLVEALKGVFLVASVVAGVLAKAIFDNWSLRSLNSARRKVVTGTWTGTAANLAVADDEPLVMQFDITFYLTAGRKIIKGTAQFHRDRDYEVTLKGGFYSDRYLKIEY